MHFSFEMLHSLKKKESESESESEKSSSEESSEEEQKEKEKDAKKAKAKPKKEVRENDLTTCGDLQSMWRESSLWKIITLSRCFKFAQATASWTSNLERFFTFG